MKPSFGERSENEPREPLGTPAAAPGAPLATDPWSDGLAEDPAGLSDGLPEGGPEAFSERELLQFDLSQMIDGELREEPAARTLERLEVLPECREFFEHMLAQLGANRDLSRPERLASIFYQVGKAYALSAFDPDWRQRVFERAVSVDAARSQGRGFIDGVASRQAEGEPERFGQVDWRQKRHLLNGLLERIERPADKAKRMLEECLRIEADYDPAHLYLGFLEQKAGLKLRAAKRFRQVFDEGVDPGNRGHAAMQLGKLYVAEGEFRTALTWFRWVGLSGLARLDERFFPANFNIGLCYAHLERPARAIEAFRSMLDRHPGRRSELAQFFARSPKLRACIDSQPGFAEALLARCPELFSSPAEGARPA